MLTPRPVQALHGSIPFHDLDHSELVVVARIAKAAALTPRHSFSFDETALLEELKVRAKSLPPESRLGMIRQVAGNFAAEEALSGLFSREEEDHLAADALARTIAWPIVSSRLRSRLIGLLIARRDGSAPVDSLGLDLLFRVFPQVTAHDARATLFVVLDRKLDELFKKGNSSRVEELFDQVMSECPDHQAVRAFLDRFSREA